MEAVGAVEKSASYAPERLWSAPRVPTANPSAIVCSAARLVARQLQALDVRREGRRAAADLLGRRRVPSASRSPTLAPGRSRRAPAAAPRRTPKRSQAASEQTAFGALHRERDGAPAEIVSIPSSSQRALPRRTTVCGSAMPHSGPRANSVLVLQPRRRRRCRPDRCARSRWCRPHSGCRVRSRSCDSCSADSSAAPSKVASWKLRVGRAARRLNVSRLATRAQVAVLRGRRAERTLREVLAASSSTRRGRRRRRAAVRRGRPGP